MNTLGHPNPFLNMRINDDGPPDDGDALGDSYLSPHAERGSYSRCPACGYYAFNGIECFDCGYRGRHGETPDARFSRLMTELNVERGKRALGKMQGIIDEFDTVQRTLAETHRALGESLRKIDEVLR